MVKSYYLFIFSCLAVIFFQAIQPAWMDHLIFDIYTFYERASYFHNHFNLSGVANNEYQPGAIIYFLLLSLSLYINNSIEFFRFFFFLGNAILVLLITDLVRRMTESKNITILGLVILSTGPILLYRFELLVIYLSLL